MIRRHGSAWKGLLLITLLGILFSLTRGEIQKKHRLSSLERAVPLYFEENRGQAPPGVRIIGRAAGTLLSLEVGGVFFSPPGPPGGHYRPGIFFEGSVARVTPFPKDPLPGRSNYYLGKGRKGSLEGIPHYGKAVYKGLYHGIDLVLHGGKGGVEYDFVLHPGSDPGDIMMRVSGASSLHLDERGGLVVVTGKRRILHRTPLIYQERKGEKEIVKGGYLISGTGVISFTVGLYDRSRDLIIDPEISFSTFLGGTSTDEGLGLFVDGNGNSYITGRTTSTDFPTQNPVQSSSAGVDDVFVSKFDSTGKTLLFSTYFGGSGSDKGRGVAVDLSGNVYVAGTTSSSDFPLLGEFQTALSGPSDAFLFKLNSLGTLLFSTYYGGGGIEEALGIKVNSAGGAFVTGLTGSTDLTTVNAFQSSFGGGVEDAFAAKIDTTARTLVYSTFLGGSGDDRGEGIAIDDADRMYIVGTTSSTDFPVKNAFQGSTGGLDDVFVSKIDLSFAGATAHIFSTYFGGSGNDRGRGITLDSVSAPYVTGSTSSSNFPLQNPFQSSLSGGFDVFLFKMSSDGNSLSYSTYIGGSGFDEGTAVALSSKKEAYLTGETTSSDFPTVDPIQSSIAGSDDIFVVEVKSSGDGLIFSTFVGGSSFDSGKGVGLDSSENVYVGGLTDSTDFPADAFDTSLDARDGFLLKIKEKKVIRFFDVVSGCNITDSSGFRVQSSER